MVTFGSSASCRSFGRRGEPSRLSCGQRATRAPRGRRRPPGPSGSCRRSLHVEGASSGTPTGAVARRCRDELPMACFRSQRVRMRVEILRVRQVYLGLLTAACLFAGGILRYFTPCPCRARRPEAAHLVGGERARTAIPTMRSLVTCRDSVGELESTGGEAELHDPRIAAHLGPIATR